MRETEQSHDFTHDVDRILQEAGRRDVTDKDSGYRNDLILAAELGATDFSDESTRRAALRREIVSGSAGTGAEASGADLRHLRLAAAGGALAIVLLVFLQPDLRAAVVEPAFRFLQRLVLGGHSQAVVVEPPRPADLDAVLAEHYRRLEAGETWSIRTAAGSLGGDVPAGAEAVLRTYNSLELARAAAQMPLREPGLLPDGYRFDRAVITPGDGVLLWYRARGKRMSLYQTSVGPDDGTMMSMSMGGDVAMQTVSVDGVAAAWIGGDKLMWERDATSFTLEGDALTLAEAIEVAGSLR